MLSDISAALPGQATDRRQAWLLPLCAMLPELFLPLVLPGSVGNSSSFSGAPQWTGFCRQAAASNKYGST